MLHTVVIYVSSSLCLMKFNQQGVNESFTFLSFSFWPPTRGRAERTGGSQSEESRPSLSALSRLCPWSFPALCSSAPWIQCNLRCPTLDKYPPALIQVTLHRRVQQGFQDSAAQVEETLRTWQRACWSKCFRSAVLHNGSTWILIHQKCIFN